MKIKMADVARYLGISKATVSLAVNGKPGVNEKTRERIFQCIEELKQNDGKFTKLEESEIQKNMKVIKVVIFNHKKQVVCDPELDLWSGVLSTFDVESRKGGYLYGLTYLNESEEEKLQIIDECNLDMVAGVILFGTEMSASDYDVVKKIQKPIVIYDYEMPDGSYSSICIDNALAVNMAVNVLIESNVSDIQYFSTNKDIYNFTKRREAFRSAQLKMDKLPVKSDVISLGDSIGEITEQAMNYLRTHKLPEAFIMENYQVSIGVLAAIRRLGISVPAELKLIGIDAVPEYALSGVQLTQIKIPHEERAALAIRMLQKEIAEPESAKIKVFAVPELVAGNSI